MQVGSSSEAIIKSMSQELVPAGPVALRPEKEQITLQGYVLPLQCFFKGSFLVLEFPESCFLSYLSFVYYMQKFWSATQKTVSAPQRDHSAPGLYC